MAQENLIVSEFDTEESLSAWSRWWGAAPQTYEFDATVNHSVNPNSGSLKGVVEFDVAAYGGDNQFALQGNLPETIDASGYTNLVMSLIWDPNSAKTPSGDFGYLEYGLKTADFGQIWLGGMNLSGSLNGWFQVNAPISPALPKIDQIAGVVLKLWSGDPVTGLTGTTTFWLDDVIFLANTNTAPTPPPTLDLAPAVPGLQLFASAAGSQYQRQSIRTVGNDYSWVGQPGPVSYALTLKTYPGVDHTGFQTHIFLIPAENPPVGSSPDYNEPNVVFIDLANNATGGAYLNFRYKTNQPAGNSMIYNSNPDNGPVGTLGGVGSTTPLGTWTITFKTETEVTLTSPDGSTSDITFPAESAALFANPLYAYFGIQPNQLSNIGQSAVFGRVQITGVPTPIDDTFVGVPPEGGGPNQLDPAVWQVAAEDPAGVVLVPVDSAWWAWWTLPANGFVLQQNGTLNGPTWQENTTPPIQVGARRGVLLPASNEASSFFRLTKPE